MRWRRAPTPTWASRASASGPSGWPRTPSPTRGLDGEPEPDWIRFFSEAELNARERATRSAISPMWPAAAPPTPRSPNPSWRRAVELFREDEEHQRSYALNLVGMATVQLLQAGARAVHASWPRRPWRSPAGALRAGQHPAPQDRRHRRPGTSATSPPSPSSPICSPRSCPRRPRRSERRAPPETRLRPVTPYSPTRLPRRQVAGRRPGRFTTPSG